MLHLGKSGLCSKPMTNDDADRLFVCLRVLSDSSPDIVEIFNKSCRDALSTMLTTHAEQDASALKVQKWTLSLLFT